MRANSFEILAITALFVNYVTGDAKTQIATETSIEDSTFVPKGQLKSATRSKPTQNMTTKAPMDYWMRRMGSMEYDLINIQAVIVKDEDLNASCEPAPRKSDKRYLMCAGSILNRNHVLTSATCVHEATHIRHNVRAPLAVVIAPLKRTMQVIPVIQYFIHPDHQTNPYSEGHVRHNIAIIKLSCRIDMENYQKIELPLLPMRQICNEENCVVAIFRRTGKTTHVMFQMLAPNMPYYYRRRKETLVQDVELHVSKEYGRSEMIDGSIHLERPKRKLAGPPSFMGKYESSQIFDDEPMVTTTETSSENLTVAETTTISTEDDNISSTIETSLHENVSKALSEPEVAFEPVKSFVVRSSQWYLPCAHTGAPVLLNRTQAALVAIPCNGRQPRSKWYYTDIYDNADWIRQILHEFAREIPSSGSPRVPSHLGNSSGGCSTCIFNFFIEIGCKEKGNCGKNVTNLPGETLSSKFPAQAISDSSHPVPPNYSHPVPPNHSHPLPPNHSHPVPLNPSDSVPFNPSHQIPANPPRPVPPVSPGQVPSNSPGEVSSNSPGEVISNPPGEVIPPDGTSSISGRRKMQGGCTRNSVGIEVGQGCDKKDKESNIRPIYRTKSVKPISKVVKMKPPLQSNSAGRNFKDPYGDYLLGKAKYSGNDNSRVSANPQNHQKSRDRNFHRERATNEIGLQNIEGESSDWLSEVEKRLELSSGVKSRRSSSN